MSGGGGGGGCGPAAARAAVAAQRRAPLHAAEAASSLYSPSEGAARAGLRVGEGVLRRTAAKSVRRCRAGLSAAPALTPALTRGSTAPA